VAQLQNENMQKRRAAALFAAMANRNGRYWSNSGQWSARALNGKSAKLLLALSNSLRKLHRAVFEKPYMVVVNTDQL
jgi:hypothetical protein